MPRENLNFFLGVDSAPSDNHRSDDGALTVAAAYPRRKLEPDEPLPEQPADWMFEYVYSRVFTSREKLSADQWSGFIHLLHQRFGFGRIVLDGGAGGGGVFVKRALMKPKQMIAGVETLVVPLCDQVDGPGMVVHGEFIVNMFKRGDPGIELVWPAPDGVGKSLAGDELLKDALYASFKTALESQIPAWPAPVEEWLGTRRDEVATWGDERQWALKNLDAGTTQLKNIIVETNSEGVMQFHKRGSHKFQSLGKDDIALSHLYCWAAFQIWLRSDDSRYQPGRDDLCGFGGASA